MEGLNLLLTLTELRLGMTPSLASTSGMPNKDRSFHEASQKTGGEGWFYSEEQQLLTQFHADARTLHAKWVELRTFTWIPPRNPVPQTTRRMLRHNALEAWAHMQKTGWVRCRPPVR